MRRKDICPASVECRGDSIERCAACPLDELDELSAGWMGEVARDAADVQCDLNIGLHRNALDLPADVRYALRVLREEEPEPEQKKNG